MSNAETVSPASLTQHELTVLLVDDQAMIGEAVRRMLAGEKDIVFHYCQDPTKALELAETLKPKVILQDLVMPQINGMDLVRQFRSNSGTHEVPMIVLSSKEEAKSKAEAFAAGANDYLVKLPDKIELIARIRYHAQGYVNLLQRNEAFQALQASQKKLAAELEEAADYVRSLLPATIAGDISTEWKFMTSTELGGDAFGYHWIDAEHFAVYLLDVCGHGVGAALLSVSAMNVLRAQSMPATDFRDPAQVLGGLNETFDMDKQNQMYFTMWYGVFNKKTRELVYGSGGHPPAVMVSEGHVSELKTGGLVIGGMPGARFQKDSCVLPPGAKLYVFSDGVYEITKADGTMMQLSELSDELAKALPPGRSKLNDVVDFAVRANGSDQFDDDFSMLEVTFL